MIHEEQDAINTLVCLPPKSYKARLLCNSQWAILYLPLCWEDWLSVWLELCVKSYRNKTQQCSAPQREDQTPPLTQFYKRVMSSQGPSKCPREACKQDLRATALSPPTCDSQQLMIRSAASSTEGRTQSHHAGGHPTKSSDFSGYDKHCTLYKSDFPGSGPESQREVLL